MTYHGEMIGYCLGDIWYKTLMNITDLAVSREFWGRGIGRYLIIRCMQNLKQHFAIPESYFGLGADRTNTRACRFYFKLGFEREWIGTRAGFSNRVED